jgi:hypothetical protein
MCKLRDIGIQGKTADWIENWLKGRKQRVVINGQSSDWANVTSGVPQGSVLGPLLFLIYVNDIESSVNNTIAMFADDSKIGNSAQNEAERQSLQNDLDKLTSWSQRWQLPFNTDKCSVVHIGSRNNHYQYKIGDVVLKESSEEKDLGVTITDNLKNSKQCISAATKASRMLGFIGRCFTVRTEEVIIPLYKSLVRPHLEYAAQFWSPLLKKDIDRLERVQRRMTKMIPRVRSLPYEDRLKALNLYSLEKRRLRGQLIETFRLVRGFCSVNMGSFFNFNNDNANLRENNGYKLAKAKSNLSLTQNYFTNKVIDTWNALPKEVCESPSIDAFKARLDKHFREQGIV